MKAAVVLIAKNQAENVPRLVESVLAQSAFVSEVIFVDSASTDSSVAIASRYPIRILRLDAREGVTPAAGRYTGFHATSGEAVLFLDGDMELYPGWLEQALPVLRSDTNVAAVSGHVLDVPPGVSGETGTFASPQSSKGVVDLRHVGGAAMYRRSVLEEVGTFNPYLHSEEEPELCLRIRAAGHRIVEVDHPIAFHYTTVNGGVSELLSRRRRNFYLGHGQAIRYLRRRRLARQYLNERGWAVLPALALLGGIASAVVSLRTSNLAVVLVWCAGMLLAVAALAVRQRSISNAYCSLILRLFLLEGMLRGIVMPANDPRLYPTRAEVIK